MILDEKTKVIEELLRKTNKLLNQYTKKKIKGYGLTMPRFHVLWMIHQGEPVNMGYLHQKLYMANSSLTVIVDYLVKDELVKRQRDPDDRRVVLLETTKQGKELIEELLNIRQGFLQQALLQLSEENKNELINTLQPVMEYIEKGLKEGESNEKEER